MISLSEWCCQNHREDILQLYLDGNNPVSPDLIGFSSGKSVRWFCRVCGLDWQASPNKTNRKGPDRPVCPFCSHERISSSYNLEKIVPEVARQWCYEKDGDLTPRKISPYNPKKVFWQCPFDPSHIWADRISNRTILLRGCPICSRTCKVSHTARAIFYYLYQNGVSCACEVQAGRYRIDIEIRPPQRDQSPIALEVDGYRHRLPQAVQRDARKDAFLQKQGYRVIRVRELDSRAGTFQADGDVINYPTSQNNLYLDRIIQHVLLLAAGIHIQPDHVHDHWDIELFYCHTRHESSLAVQYPQLAAQWSKKNTDSPQTVSPGSNSKRWWTCPKCGRDYQARLYNRTHNHSDCPFCARNHRKES